MTEKARKIARDVLKLSKADETEVIVSEGVSALTRFASNTIHQNVAEENVSVTVRVVSDNRIGIASGNNVSKGGLRALAAKAVDIAAQQPRKPDFPGLPQKRPLVEVEAYSREVSSITPARRAAAALEIITPAADAGASASGAVSLATGALAVANSHGVEAFVRESEFSASTVIEKDSGSGYASAVSWTPRRVNASRIGSVALTKCLSSADPRAIEPGSYTVILEPQAVADLLGYMGYMGFGAEAFLEGRSFMSRRIGNKIMHESVSIWDDGLDERGMPMPFDFEGMPKQRVNLIENGVARGVAYDSYYAAKAGGTSTGHALPPGYGGGPLPTNLFMAGGESSLEEMVSSTARGLLVTRFHYVNIADPSKAVLTGLTRDGTFLVENGKIGHPVKNLRFTHSMLEAFSSVEAISRQRSLEPGMLGSLVVPAVKLAGFRFSGATEF